MLKDFLVTIICWVWFLLGGILFFLWRYAVCALFVKEPEVSFQRLNSRFYQVFFRLLRVLAPSHRWEIAKEVRAIRSAVIVCNHISYLDPLLLIALFERHRTIVKTRFFKMPIWGWIIQKSGYFPATGEGRFTGMMLEQMEAMPGFLQEGGNLFVFPEGTRSRDGQLGALNRGALKIARLCRAPVYVLRLSNTDKLFAPGKFMFQTRVRNTITLKIIDRIEPGYQHDKPSIAMLEQRLRDAYSEREP